MPGSLPVVVVKAGEEKQTCLDSGPWTIKVILHEYTFDIRVIDSVKCQDYGRVQTLKINGPTTIRLDNSYSWFADKHVVIEPDSDHYDPKEPPVKATQRSEMFIRIVEQFDPKSGNSAEKSVGKLPSDSLSRKQTLVNIYTGNSHYYAVNRCLREDDETTMCKYAGFIHELREVFRTDAAVAFSKPFSGHVRRGINHPNPAKYLQQLAIGEEFVWPSFTSTSTAAGFGGNVHFEIACTLTGSKAAEYAPMSISQYSQYKSEHEVLFPPHVRFRVVNIKGKIVQLETVDFPAVWDLIKKKDWAGFKQWADANPERVDTKECIHSMINKVAESLLIPSVEAEASSAVDPLEEIPSVETPAPSAINPLEVCLQHHADINEEDKVSGTTPVILAAKALAKAKEMTSDMGGVQGSGMQLAQTTLEWCLSSGGNAFKKTKSGAAVDFCPEAQSIQEAVKPKKFRWDYFVDDGVDHKTTGWYPYELSVWPQVEKHFDAWRKGASSQCVVQSKSDAGTSFMYQLDFNSMMQTNTTTKKQRNIRRAAV